MTHSCHHKCFSIRRKGRQSRCCRNLGTKLFVGSIRSLPFRKRLCGVDILAKSIIKFNLCLSISLPSHFDVIAFRSAHSARGSFIVSVNADGVFGRFGLHKMALFVDVWYEYLMFNTLSIAAASKVPVLSSALFLRYRYTEFRGFRCYSVTATKMHKTTGEKTTEHKRIRQSHAIVPCTVLPLPTRTHLCGADLAVCSGVWARFSRR